MKEPDLTVRGYEEPRDPMRGGLIGGKGIRAVEGAYPVADGNRAQRREYERRLRRAEKHRDR